MTERKSEIATIKSALPEKAGWDLTTITLRRETSRGTYFAVDIGDEWMVWSTREGAPTIGYFASIAEADLGIARFEAEQADYIGPTNVDADGREVA